ncbi:MAG: SAM-dependent methyltransferase [Betaproteobacteria bacterium]
MPAASWIAVPPQDPRHALPQALRARDPLGARDCGWVEQMTPFVRSHASAGGWIVDPFCGFGSTLVAALLEGVPAVGVDLDPLRVALARERLAGLAADAARYPQFAGTLADDTLRATLRGPDPQAPRRFTLCLTNVPYFGCDGPSPDDSLYAERSYEPYLQGLRAVFEGVHALLEPGGWCVAMAQNLRLQGTFVPLAWDVARLLGERFQLHEERLLVYPQPEGDPHERSATHRAHEYAIVCRKASAHVDADVATRLLTDLAESGFEFVLYGSLARRLAGDAAVEPNDIDLLCPADDAEVSRLLQWLEARGFRIESWNAPFTPPVSVEALAYRHYFRARRVARDGATMQVDVALVADRGAWEATLAGATCIGKTPVLLHGAVDAGG